MKKILSVAIATLLAGNVALGDNIQNSLLESIQQKIDNKKSNLGSNIQTNSGLAGFQKNNKDKDSILLNNDITKKDISIVENITSETKLIKKTDSAPLHQEKIQEKQEKVKQTQDVNKNMTPVTKQDDISKEEFCDPLLKKSTALASKPVIKKFKKVVKKPIVKKHLVKVPTKNNIEMGNQYYQSPNVIQTITPDKVKLSLLDNDSHFELFISDIDGQVIPKEQFSQSFLRFIQVTQDFNIISHEEKEINILNKSYVFNKEVKKCSAIFIQYSLKNNINEHTFVKYINQNGILSDHIDTSCMQKSPEDLPTNLNYSQNNNISGLFFKNNKLLSSQPVVFHIIFTKDGITRTPNDLFVYAIKQDLSDFSVLKPLSYGNGVNGILFEKKFMKGNYLLGYSFKEGKFENYLKNIHVD